jgi:predicted phosphoadenosine phosphosulfate sulfurtransferase
MNRRYLSHNVYEAAKERISLIFDRFEAIYVGFSGGKDSAVLLHLVAEEAKLRQRKFGVLFIDWEAQFNRTITFVSDMFKRYAENIIPYWVALPLRTTNACSMIAPEWTCWDPDKQLAWVRSLPEQANKEKLPFYHHNMTFEEFVVEFGNWYARDTPAIGLLGLRTSESLNRWRAITQEKAMLDDLRWTTYYGKGSYAAYPIYDWQVNDIWGYLAKGKPYNTIYDLMFKAGLKVSQMRVCEPYGDEQRRGLWLYQILEPATWGAVAARVAGANSASLYCKEKGNILGNRAITKPPGHTWESFTKFLLSTIPRTTAEHYRNKFSVWRKWYENHGQVIADELPGDTGSTDMPSWRRLCRVLLKNDYWCRSLSFAPMKTSAYERYKQLMAKRRAAWKMEW